LQPAQHSGNITACRTTITVALLTGNITACRTTAKVMLPAGNITVSRTSTTVTVAKLQCTQLPLAEIATAPQALCKRGLTGTWFNSGPPEARWHVNSLNSARDYISKPNFHVPRTASLVSHVRKPLNRRDILALLIHLFYSTGRETSAFLVTASCRRVQMPQIISCTVTSMQRKRTAYVAGTEKTRNAYMIIGKPKGKRPLARRTRRFEDNIKMSLY
jgi:hypothetical protein